MASDAVAGEKWVRAGLGSRGGSCDCSRDGRGNVLDNMNGNGYAVLGTIGYSDVEGIDFVPTPTGLPVPELATALLPGGGLIGLSVLRKTSNE